LLTAAAAAARANKLACFALIGRWSHTHTPLGQSPGEHSSEGTAWSPGWGSVPQELRDTKTLQRAVIVEGGASLQAGSASYPHSAGPVACQGMQALIAPSCQGAGCQRQRRQRQVCCHSGAGCLPRNADFHVAILSWRGRVVRDSGGNDKQHHENTNRGQPTESSSD
jgi:hypothetical protein